MKFSYRVTKYDPAFRNEKGWYLKDDWTAYSDINREYNKETLTLDKYLEVENQYMQAIIQFMKCNKVTAFQVTRITRNFDPAEDPNSSQDMINIYKNIKNRSFVSEEELKNVCKLILRRYLWCLLRNDKNMEVRFSHDYYMFIVSKSMCKKAISNIEKSGLFVEKYRY